MKIKTEHLVMRKHYKPDDYEFTGVYCNAEGDGGTGGGTAPPAGGAPGDTGGAPTPPPTAPWAAAGDKPWMIGDGANAKPWYAAIPEEGVRQTMEAKQYSNPAVLATAYSNLLKLQTGNANVVEIPGENATQEQRDAFYTKLGRPVDATKYDFSPAFAEDVKANPDFKPHEGLVKFGQNVAFKLGLNTTQAQTMAAEYRKYEMEAATANQAQWQRENDIAIEGLKRTYGGEYESYIAAGKRAYSALGLDAATATAIERSMGAAPVVDLLCRLGRASAEGGIVSNNGGGGGSSNNPNSMTPEAAAAEIERLQGDAEFQRVYTTKNDPGNRNAVERMNQLYARAGGSVRM